MEFKPQEIALIFFISSITCGLQLEIPGGGVCTRRHHDRRVGRSGGTFQGKISKALLKPQQWLAILRNFYLPRLMHRLVLGRITDGRLV